MLEVAALVDNNVPDPTLEDIEMFLLELADWQSLEHNQKILQEFIGWVYGVLRFLDSQ